MKVKLDSETIEITKLPIGRYDQFLKVIKEILSKAGVLSDLTNLTNEEFLGKLPEIIAENLPQVIKIIQIGTGMPEDKIAALGLNECIDVVMAIFEVNKYSEVYEKIKKATARLPKQNLPTKVTGLPMQ